MIRVNSIFPTPLLQANMTSDITDSDKLFIKSLESDVRENEGNFTSNNNYILEEPELQDLKQKINQYLEEYFKQIICPGDNVKHYITMSWANFTHPGGYHHIHKHPNSIVSGVLYIQCVENDQIVFTRDNHQSIRIVPEQLNEYNCETVFIQVRENMLLLFPSHLTHNVPNIDQGKRISISFNTFIKGNIGTKESLTELSI